MNVPSFIPLSVPSIRGNEWKYVKECLDTGWVSSVGSFVDRFEKEICDYTGAPYAVACVNGTAALHVALIVAGVEPGDEVIVPTMTFIAPVNVVRYVGAEPVFMDCDAYYNIDPEKTIAFIEGETELRNGASYNRSTGRRVSAVIPVHVFGNAVALDDLLTVCRERRIVVVEDATESLGTYYVTRAAPGRHAGTMGDIGTYSFNGNKIITTGGGGMMVTGCEEWALRAKYLTTQAKDDEIRYVHNEIGYNYRLTNVQAAMGVAQLEQLESYIEVKRRNYERYRRAIESMDGLHLAETPGYARSNLWFYCLQIDEDAYGIGLEGLMDLLAAQRVQSRPVWELNHLQAPYRNCQTWHIERAPMMHARTLNVPCSVELSEADVDRVCDLLRNAGS